MPEPDLLAEPPLVVLSHLRWDWVWQRPQQIISRLAAHRDVFFVEEPQPGHVGAPCLMTVEAPPVTRVWLSLPRDPGQEFVRFGEPKAAAYRELLPDLVGDRVCDVWLYTPMASDVAVALNPRVLVYDVMDDLGSFADAPEGHALRQRRLLERADVVFTGGRTLHKGVSAVRRGGTYLFPSGVDTKHYACAREHRAPTVGKVAGYVGVLDERLDVDLMGALAQALPDWTFRYVGPVTKIDPATLPRHDNIEYLGQQPYDELPRLMAGFDVALMPFALNDATRSISPTKTLEYIAAGLPVVSTRIADVVSDFGDVVHLADDADGFAAACREVVEHSLSARDARAEVLHERYDWDVIAAEMAALMRHTGAADRVVAAEAGRSA